MNLPHPLGTGDGTAVPVSSTPPSDLSRTTTAALHPSRQPPSLTRRIRLTKQHIHAGLPKRPGEEIELLQDLADWLVAEGAAQEISPAQATSAAAALSPASTAPSTTPVPLPSSKQEK